MIGVKVDRQAQSEERNPEVKSLRQLRRLSRRKAVQ
jgi:hypothetical protein